METASLHLTALAILTRISQQDAVGLQDLFGLRLTHSVQPSRCDIIATALGAMPSCHGPF